MIACAVPIVNDAGEEVGLHYRRCETSQEIATIERELAAIGALCTRKVHLSEDLTVTYLDEFIICLEDADSEDTNPCFQIAEAT